MIVKSGKVRIIKQENENDYGGGSCEVDILSMNVNGRNWVMTSRVKDSSISGLEAPYIVECHRGINVENEDSLLSLLTRFTMFGVKSYEWIDPLTEDK